MSSENSTCWCFLKESLREVWSSGLLVLLDLLGLALTAVNLGLSLEADLEAAGGAVGLVTTKDQDLADPLPFWGVWLLARREGGMVLLVVLLWLFGVAAGAAR